MRKGKGTLKDFNMFCMIFNHKTWGLMNTV